MKAIEGVFLKMLSLKDHSTVTRNDGASAPVIYRPGLEDIIVGRMGSYINCSSKIARITRGTFLISVGLVLQRGSWTNLKVGFY